MDSAPNANQHAMWSNAGLSTSVLITACLPANGMVHHTVAKIFVSTKLRDLGPKSSATRTFWRMVATCIRYQPPTEHLLWDLITFNLASVKTPCIGTGFLGLAYPFILPNGLDDTPEFPQIPPICPDDYVSTIGGKDVLRIAVVTPLPPIGVLETVLLSLKEGDKLSESTIRRLRRKEAEIRAAAVEGRAPVSEYRRRKLKKIATRTSASQVACGLLSEKGSPALQGPDIASTTRDPSPLRRLQQEPTMQFVTAVNPCNIDLRKVSVEDVGRLAASASVRRHPDSQRRTSQSHA